MHGLWIIPETRGQVIVSIVMTDSEEISFITFGPIWLPIDFTKASVVEGQAQLWQGISTQALERLN